MNDVRVEPVGSTAFGRCQCCGKARQLVWGFACGPSGVTAGYEVEWTPGTGRDHGARITLTFDGGANGVTTGESAPIALDYWWDGGSPRLHVMDAEGVWWDQAVVEQVMGHAASSGSPTGPEVVAVATAVLARDARLVGLFDGGQPAEPGAAPDTAV